MTGVGIHWFRRDLRFLGNSALLEHLAKQDGRVLGLFCFDSAFLSRSDFSHRRFAFFLETLRNLKKDLEKAGGELLVVDDLPETAFPRLIQWLKEVQQPVQRVSFNRDYEPFSRQRDHKILRIIKELGIETETSRDHLLIEPEEILKSDGSFYQIYSPFAKRWFELLRHKDFATRLSRPRSRKFQLRWADLPKKHFPYRDALESFAEKNHKHIDIEIPEAGAAVARKRLLVFKKKVRAYLEERDIPSANATSGLSIFLKNGSLTSGEIISELELSHESFFQKSGPTQFLKELVWREFYYSILFHNPKVETTAFQGKYADLKWENRKSWFTRWCAGTTGFPIVDAGMRQLNQTGWMHNRVRMIVASFLSKDLLIDWRWGENYFMKMLLDGDLAPNNGGWQWAASTGCDPQPYFRVFNPWLQGEKFDPEGIYIKKYIPELRDCPAQLLHDPKGDRRKLGYPDPMVDHREQKEKALRLYRV